MTVLWDKIKKNIVNSLNEAIDKTEELTSVGRIKLEILQLEHQLDEQYTTLGQFIYKHLDKDSEILKSDKRLQELKKAIDQLEKELRMKEKELGRIREEDGIDFD
jgi:superoxide dismutase